MKLIIGENQNEYNVTGVSALGWLIARFYQIKTSMYNVCVCVYTYDNN